MSRARMRRAAAGFAVALMTATAVPEAARAQAPTVATGRAVDITQTTAVLRGTINPRGAATTYYFELGTTRQYGSATPVAGPIRGRSPITVALPVGAMSPATRYHYRLVARSRNGIRSGRDRTFRTAPQPLGLSVAAVPASVFQGGTSRLVGSLSGTGNVGRPVVLQSNPFPYTQGFVTITNPQLTNAQGAFEFPVLDVAVTTQYRAVVADAPAIVSPVASVGVALRVGTRVRVVRRPQRRGGRARVRFTGRISPAPSGAPINIQRLRRGTWRIIATGFARPASAGASRYSKTIRIRRGGRFRVFASSDGAFVSNAGREVRVRVRRR